MNDLWDERHKVMSWVNSEDREGLPGNVWPLLKAVSLDHRPIILTGKNLQEQMDNILRIN